MVESSENPEFVLMKRRQQVGEASQRYQQAISEGRLVVKPRQGAPTDGSAALVAASHDGAGGQVATSAPISEVATSAALPVEVPPADPEAAWRHTRLAITAGLVVLLLVIWIWQKRAGR